jgi:hypothetical protein
MKKLILALTIAFVFVAGSAFAATMNMIMYASENNGYPNSDQPSGYNAGNAGPTITADYTFTVDTTAGNITNFTDLFQAYFYTATIKDNGKTYTAGGYDPRNDGYFTMNQKVFGQGETVSVAEVAFDGTTTGGDAHGLWFYGQSNTSGPLAGAVFKVGLLGISYDTATNKGIAAFGPNMSLAELYLFHAAPAIPIPAAAWLLLSGLVGIIGLRRKS